MHISFDKTTRKLLCNFAFYDILARPKYSNSKALEVLRLAIAIFFVVLYVVVSFCKHKKRKLVIFELKVLNLLLILIYLIKCAGVYSFLLGRGYLESEIVFSIQAILFPNVLIVCSPSKSFFTSSGVNPCTEFQYCEVITGID